MDVINTATLKILINRCYDAVNESKVGPIQSETLKDANGNPQLNNVAYHTYLSLISNLTPKNMNQSWKDIE